MNKTICHPSCHGLLMSMLLAACSGGNISVDIDGPVIPPITPPVTPPTGTSEAITSHGPVTGFGDLAVNGVRYKAGTASVTINARPGQLTELETGHIVTLTGRVDDNGLTGRASTVRFDATVIGPLDNVDSANRRLSVMGQTVLLDTDTHYSPGIEAVTLAGLSVGETIQVSGFADAAGAIRATRVEPTAANVPLQIIGKVSGLDLANLRFAVNRLTVDYGSALLIDVPGGAPSGGMTIKAIGTLSDGLFMVEQLVAAPGPAGVTGQRIQLAGVVTRFRNASDFDVNDMPVSGDSATLYSNGRSSDLALNAGLIVDGVYGSGHIGARRITFGRLASNTVTVPLDLENFSEISVPTVFGITVTYGTDYSVEVDVDQEAADRINVTRSGSRLTFALEAGNGSIEVLEARVTMPVLDRIDLTGVVHARIIGFNQSQMTINVGNVSNLQGDALHIRHLLATVSGVSRLDLGGIHPIDRADIDVSGVSEAILNMGIGSTLNGSVTTGQGTGVSTLYYYGTNVTVNVATGSNASVIRLGNTRP